MPVFALFDNPVTMLALVNWRARKMPNGSMGCLAVRSRATNANVATSATASAATTLGAVKPLSGPAISP